MAIEAGRVLNGRYRLIRPVGQGSQASVWVAEHLALTTHVAVKLIDPELAKRESARERFRREATAAAQLRSAHVVQILDHGIDGDQPFIVMELLDGEDLFERLAHRNRLSLRETSKIVTQVARALSRAHAAGIVHRDLKPENVFLCPNEDDEVVKVLDFGVAKVKDAAKVTMQKTGVGTLIGTPHYMSPEQVKGIGDVNYHADLWALSVIAFQCVTGELPFDSEGVGDLLIKITIGDAPVPSKVYPGVHPSFDAWYGKAGARDAAKRFQSAREMALALVSVVSAIDGVAPRAPTVRPPPPTAAGAGLGIPQAPRAVTEQLDAVDWELVDDDEDDAPTRMKEVVSTPPPAARPAPAPGKPVASPPTPTAPSPHSAQPGTVAPAHASAKPSAQPAHEAPAPKPTAPARSVPPGAAAPSAPAPSLGDRRVPTTSSAAPPRAPRPTTNAPPGPGPVRATVATDHDSHDIVDFDETIPAHDLHRQSIALPLLVRAGAGRHAGPNPQDLDRAPSPARDGGGSPAAASAALVPLSEPPRSTRPAPARDSGAPALLAPVVTMTRPPVTVGEPPQSQARPVAMGEPPRSHPAPPTPKSPVPMDAAPTSIPRPPPSSRPFAPPSAGSARPSAAPVVTPLESRPRGVLLTESPPELDGTKRRRMVRFMVAGLVMLAVGVTWSVVRSQLDLSPGVAVPPTALTSAVAPPPPPPTAPALTDNSATATAVDPGKVTHPTKPSPSVHRGPMPLHSRVPRQSGDGTIVVPEPDEESVPSAP